MGNQRKKGVLGILIENAVLLVTVGFTVYVLLQSQRQVIQDREILLWLLSIVGLLATSELIQRLLQLKRIEDSLQHFIEIITKSGLKGDVSVYTQRVDAADEIKSIIYAEKQEVTIIAGTLGGMFLLFPDLPDLIAKIFSSARPKLRILISHPDWMAQRSSLEGLSSEQERQKTLQKIHAIFETTTIPADSIRLYKSSPTCSAIIAHSQRKLLINPYTLGNRASATMTLVIDGETYADAFQRFVKAHYETPWNRSDLTMSMGDFVRQQNESIEKMIMGKIVEIWMRHPKDRPMFVAINGCTAAGKTRLSRELSAALMDQAFHDIGIQQQVSVTHLETDNWLATTREERVLRGLSGFDANSYNMTDLAEAIQKLSNVAPVLVKRYEHSNLPIDTEITYNPADIVILDGLMSTHHSLLKSIDLCIWIECSENGHRSLRIGRDTKYRQYKQAEAESNWKLHAAVWPKFEQAYKPKNAVVIRTNSTGMLLEG
jgi:uridine kinase